LRMMSRVRRTGSEEGPPSCQATPRPMTGRPTSATRPPGLSGWICGWDRAGGVLWARHDDTEEPAGVAGRLRQRRLAAAGAPSRRRCEMIEPQQHLWLRSSASVRRRTDDRHRESAMAASTAEIWKGPDRSEAGWMATSRAVGESERGMEKCTAPPRPPSDSVRTASSKRRPAPTPPMTVATSASGLAPSSRMTACASGSSTGWTALRARCRVVASRAHSERGGGPKMPPGAASQRPPADGEGCEVGKRGCRRTSGWAAA
jgi:hypothetical protein